MELVLPSIFLLLLASIFAYLVVPRFGAMTLAIVSFLALIAAVGDHAYRFSSEYRLSTWQDSLRQYSAWIVLGFSLLIAIGFLMQMVAFAKGGKATAEEQPTVLEHVTNLAQNSIAAMPTVTASTNSLVATVNKGLNAMGVNTTAPSASSTTQAKNETKNQAKPIVTNQTKPIVTNQTKPIVTNQTKPIVTNQTKKANGAAAPAPAAGPTALPFSPSSI